MAPRPLQIAAAPGLRAGPVHVGVVHRDRVHAGLVVRLEELVCTRASGQRAATTHGLVVVDEPQRREAEAAAIRRRDLPFTRAGLAVERLVAPPPGAAAAVVRIAAAEALVILDGDAAVLGCVALDDLTRCALRAVVAAVHRGIAPLRIAREARGAERRAEGLARDRVCRLLGQRLAARDVAATLTVVGARPDTPMLVGVLRRSR